MRLDVWSGMFFSNLVMFFIITACASTLFKNGIHNINTATDAAEALRPFAGNFSYMLFTLGILGTGFLSIPVLAGSASYAVSESLGWKFGLYRKWKEATSFYGVIVASVVLGILFNFLGFNPIKTLIYSAVLNGLIAPIAIYFIVRIANREDIMGTYKNKFWGNLFGWLTFVVMFVVSVAALIFLLV
jgi:Mn2+/Fe2+ NRAMP family transporter